MIHAPKLPDINPDPTFSLPQSATNIELIHNKILRI